MSNIKTIATSSFELAKIAEKATIIIMTLAAVFGLVDIPSRVSTRAVVPGAPVFSMSLVNTELNNPMRREKEEAGVHYVSYSETQRTQSRSGKR
jgi:hypothetical protein